MFKFLLMWIFSRSLPKASKKEFHFSILPLAAIIQSLPALVTISSRSAVLSILWSWLFNNYHCISQQDQPLSILDYERYMEHHWSCFFRIFVFLTLYSLSLSFIFRQLLSSSWLYILSVGPRLAAAEETG